MKSSLLVLAATAVSGSVLPRAQEPCPFHTPAADAVPSHYIVKLKTGHTLEEHFAKIGKDLRESGDTFWELPMMNAYHAKLDDPTVHQSIRYDPMVEYVEQDHYIETPHNPSEDPPEGWDHYDLKARSEHERRQSEFFVTDELSEKWHALITAGHTVNPLNRNFEPRAYNFEGAGAGVDIYVLDSGVRLSHSWFQGRASNFGNGPNSTYTGGPADDRDSHGTHVASIAAKVAPNANIVNVKVTCKRVVNQENAEPNCDTGTGGGVVRAINDIALAHEKKKAFPQGFRGSVINISFGLAASYGIADAINVATKEAGIPVAVAAGNGNTDKVLAPCTYNKNTVCVGAVDNAYKKWEGSNFGKKLGIHAPGQLIRAASINGDDKVDYKSGTSQASPMVAGTMALIVGWEAFDNNVNAVYARLRNNTLPDAVKGFDANTVTAFLNTGIRNPNKDDMVPYLGATPSFSFPGIPNKAKVDVAEKEAVVAADAASTTSDSPPVNPTAPEAPSSTGDGSASPDPTASLAHLSDSSAVEPQEPTGDPNASGKSPEPTSAIQIPKGFASVGIASAANSSVPATITLSWTAPLDGPTDEPTENPSTVDDIWTLSDGGPTSSAPPSTSTSAPPSTTTTSAAPSKTPDMNSDECKNCQSTLGASDCKADDLDCLHNQCKADKDCQTCGLDCNTVGGTK